MNESRTLPLRRKTTIHEYIDDETDEYIKSTGERVENYGFWLRFISEWFHPCDKCQQNLSDLILNAKQMIIGNKDYAQPIELKRQFDIDDDSWKEVERRTSTKKDFINIWGIDKGERFWNEYMEKKQ